MRKPFVHTELSNLRCKHPGCYKRLKMNLIYKHPDAEFCYFHWVLNKIHQDNHSKRLHLFKIKSPAVTGLKNSLNKSEVSNESLAS